MGENRRYDIDWLRNLGILLLFPFHSARVFDYWDPQDGPIFPGVDILISILRTFNVWLTLAVILGFGHKFLNFPHKAIPYMNEAAFPIYIIHQSVLVVIGYYVLTINLGMILSFFLIMVLTLLISWLIYEFIIKRTAITRWIFGVKVNRNNQKNLVIWERHHEN
ncbi:MULTISPECIES: hypothetical protein [Neobacillus]|uniref:Acyltransferase 3 domain-containing protein n=1 Tax=Neobacillus rhizophilus TaxID=2833579 RepID=A0A942U437_9BACI|nr:MULTISPECIES: hypothetical protein [Neobacillus]MBS4211204.1 hypothetical protein [Neobacillus rhizophilus]MBU8918728.1 hypothetical protein [Bacillus sp. FJAT-29953]